jgi:hypothetical protein
VDREWTAAAPERIDPDKIAGERQALEQWLDYHRQTLLLKCGGLTAEQLRERAVPPSNLSLLGLVRHLADAERGWLRQCAAREDVPDLYDTTAEPQADFDDIETADPEAALDTYRREVTAARDAVAGMALDDVVPFPWGGSGSASTARRATSQRRSSPPSRSATTSVLSAESASMTASTRRADGIGSGSLGGSPPRARCSSPVSRCGGRTSRTRNRRRFSRRSRPSQVASAVFAAE